MSWLVFQSSHRKYKSRISVQLSCFVSQKGQHGRFCTLGIGRSENKTIMKFSSYENEIRPGVVMTSVIFFYVQGESPSILDIIVKFYHHV